MGPELEYLAAFGLEPKLGLNINGTNRAVLNLAISRPRSVLLVRSSDVMMWLLCALRRLRRQSYGRKVLYV